MNIDQKNELIAATRHHAEMDMLIRGDYNNGETGYKFKGCSVGCLANDLNLDHLETYGHKEVAEYYGYPEWLVRLQDVLFEEASTDIHVELAEAIHPREDWTQVHHAIQYRILKEVTLPHAGESAEVVRQVMKLHEDRCDDPGKWSAAWSAAESVAESVAWSAAESAARSASAAESAAESAAAAWSARSAARSAWLAARSAAEPAAWQTIVNIVLEEVANENH